MKLKVDKGSNYILIKKGISKSLLNDYKLGIHTKFYKALEKITNKANKESAKINDYVNKCIYKKI